MHKGLMKLILFIFAFIIFITSHSFGEIVKKIEIIGNERISDKTIKIFTEVSLNDNLNENNLLCKNSWLF